MTNGASINITTGSNITTNQGNVTLDGPASSFARLTTALNNNQGSFTLKNDRDLTTAGALANSGSVNVDGAGTTLTIPGANAWWCISLEKSNAATLADRVARGDSGSSFSNQTHYRMSPFLDAAGFVCHWSARR